MAEITPLAPWTSAQSRAQFGAVAWLRWRILRNSLRRKGNVGDLVATIIMVPLFLGIVFFPTIGAGFAAWYAVHDGHFEYLTPTLWVIFLLCQLANIQLGQPGTTFDPTLLIRFPVNFRRYAVIRVFFGLISPANIVTTLMSLAVALGIVVAEPSLWFFALVAMLAFALCNIFFTRMLFAWVDRWLSTRRAREVFTAVLFVGGMSFQYLNFTYNPGFHHGRHAQAVNAARIAAARGYYHTAEPFLSALPPGLAAHSIWHAHTTQYGLFALQVAGVLLFTGVFFAIFATRLYKEFRGENLSDVANAVSTRKPHKAALAVPAIAGAQITTLSAAASKRNTILAVLEKEFITMRRNSGIFYALVAPLVMVVLFANLRAGRTPAGVLFPAAVAYTLMGVAPLCYNVLGFEGAGIQMFSLAPVSMREVFIAKNLMNVGLAVVELVSVYVAITLVDHRPDSLTAVSVLLWATFTIFLSLYFGNRRSITAPKKVDLTKMAKNQAGPMSALISIGLLLVSAGIGAGLLFAANAFNYLWLLPIVMLVFALAGYVLYTRGLASLDRLFLANRDTLSETLSKA